MCLVFFFQAEDGIRDHCVTGVQTCALPICHTGHAIGRREHRERAPRSSVAAHARSEERRVGKSVDLGGRRIIKKKKHNIERSSVMEPTTQRCPYSSVFLEHQRFYLISYCCIFRVGCYFVFCFSSRRRHTRSLCDWSSDVCSSDLKKRIQSSGCVPQSSPRPSRPAVW